MRDEPAQPRQDAVGNTSYRWRGRPGITGSPNSRIARRPPGLMTRASSARAASGLRDVADAESDRRRVGPAVAHAESRVASPRTSVIATVERALATLSSPIAASRRRNRRRRSRAPARASAAAIAKSAVPVQRSTMRASPARSQLADRARAPALVEAGAEDVIEEVVAAGDRVEHRRDARGGLVEGDRHADGYPSHLG